MTLSIGNTKGCLEPQSKLAFLPFVAQSRVDFSLIVVLSLNYDVAISANVVAVELSCC